jgi:CheY-like chemotaxis protein
MKSSDLKLNHRILIVDDNTSIHNDFREILCPDRSGEAAADEMEAALFGDEKPAVMSFELDSAYQGQEALEMVKAALAEDQPYALAFVDVRMPPGWDGVETIARIWEADPELQIVVCTAYADYSWEEMRATSKCSNSLTPSPKNGCLIFRRACRWRKWRRPTSRWPLPKSASPKPFTKAPFPAAFSAWPISVLWT